MKFFIVLFTILGYAFASNLVVPATTLVRSPEHDSAIIKSDRIGGAFSYSSIEGHAYKAYSPIVHNVVKPVAVTYNTHFAPLTYAAPLPYAATYRIV